MLVFFTPIVHEEGYRPVTVKHAQVVVIHSSMYLSINHQRQCSSHVLQGQCDISAKKDSLFIYQSLDTLHSVFQ